MTKQTFRKSLNKTEKVKKYLIPKGKLSITTDIDVEGFETVIKISEMNEKIDQILDMKFSKEMIEKFLNYLCEYIAEKIYEKLKDDLK